MSETKPAQAEENKQEEKKEETAEEQLPSLLRSFDNAPSEDQIEAWKTQHGDVFVSGFSESDIFVWRAITRAEYCNSQEQAANPEQALNQFQMEELVCSMCLLWASRNESLLNKGGTISSLFEQIMQNSNFLTPQAASLLVVKL